MNFIHANRHNWEGSSCSSKFLKVSMCDKEDSSRTVSCYSQLSNEGSTMPRPPLVVDPPTPTDLTSESGSILRYLETPLVTAEKTVDLSSDDVTLSQGDSLHFSAASCIDGQQSSLVSSLKGGSSSILERKIVQWAAQILTSLESLHIAGIVCG